MKLTLKPILLGVVVGVTLPILFGPYGGCAVMTVATAILMMP